MSSCDGVLKLHINFGGTCSFKENKFSHVGGITERNLSVDPDLICWQIFEEMVQKRHIGSILEKVWYKFTSEDISEARAIYLNKDDEIRKMCEESRNGGEFDVFLEVGKGNVEDGEDEAESDSEAENRDEEGQQSDSEEDILAEGNGDPRLTDLFAQAEATQMPVNPEDDCDSESEDERLEGDGLYPDSLDDSDEEWFNFHEKKAKRKGNQERSRDCYEKPPYLWLMQTFRNGDEFKDQLLRYVLKTQFDVKLSRCESTKQAAVCTHSECKWRIYCSFEKPIRKWMVKVYEDKHNHLPTGRARLLKQTTIAKLFKEEARRRPDIKGSDIKDELMRMYNISVSIYKCRKARRLALDMVLDTQKQQFAKLWDYEAELVRSNKDITTDIVTVEEEGKQVFHSFYVCFEPIKRAWRNCCRPMIGVDGAFLKWELKGEILSAVGRDAENRIFPIAWAVVRGENKDSWEWFIKKLRDDLQLGLGNGISFISDRQKGLQIAIASVFPNAEHRNCARHVFGNWRKKYGDADYRSFFWNIAYSRSVGEYELHMEELRLFDREAHEALLAAEPKTWCRAFFSLDGKSADICNNLSESFNKTIKKARELPLINMLEAIRRQAMRRIARRFEQASRCLLQFPKKIADILEANREESKDCKVITSSNNLFEVELHGCSYEVSLRTRHCACRAWDLTGIPCTHALCVINEKHQDPAK